MTSVSISSSMRTSPLSLISLQRVRVARFVNSRPEHDGRRRIGGDRRRGRRNAYVVALDLRRDLGKLGDRQFVAVGQHDGAKHRVLELADVARPVIGGEQRERVVGDAADALALFDAEAGEKAHGEIRHVARRARNGGMEIGNTLRR